MTVATRSWSSACSCSPRACSIAASATCRHLGGTVGVGRRFPRVGALDERRAVTLAAEAARAVLGMLRRFDETHEALPPVPQLLELAFDRFEALEVGTFEATVGTGEFPGFLEQRFAALVKFLELRAIRHRIRFREDGAARMRGLRG